MKRAAAFLGLDERYMHLYINWNVLMVNYSDEEHSFSKFQRCEKHGINLTSISQVSKLTWKAIKENYSLEQYEQALNDIKATPRSFTPWQVAIGGGLPAADSASSSVATGQPSSSVRLQPYWVSA